MDQVPQTQVVLDWAYRSLAAKPCVCVCVCVQ